MIEMERAASTEMDENTYEILDRNYESKGPLRITRLQWKDSVKCWALLKMRFRQHKI